MTRANIVSMDRKKVFIVLVANKLKMTTGCTGKN